MELSIFITTYRSHHFTGAFYYCPVRKRFIKTQLTRARAKAIRLFAELRADRHKTND